MERQMATEEVSPTLMLMAAAVFLTVAVPVCIIVIAADACERFSWKN